MRAHRRTDKTISKLLMGMAAVAILLAVACTPTNNNEDTNSAPQLVGIELTGDKPGVTAGETFTLSANAWDADGDAMTFEWSGPGTFDQSNPYDASVQWTLPGNASDEAEVKCVVSDGKTAARDSTLFDVGRSIRAGDYGAPIGNTVIWSNSGADDPPFYVIYGSVTIPQGVNLLIQPGTLVYCEQGSRLILGGGLRIMGDDSDLVEFRAFYDGDSQTENFWSGIEFNSYEEPAVLQYLTIRNANIGLKLWSQTHCELNFVFFLRCNQGINAYSAELNARSCDATDSSAGFEFTDGCSITLRGCQFNDLRGSALIIANGCQGSCEDSFFDAIGGEQFITLSAHSDVAFNDNTFLGSGRVLYAANYDAGEDIDLRCNYWGPVGTGSDILGRLAGNALDNCVVEPYKSERGGECGTGAGPPIAVASGIYVDGSRHLYASAYGGDVNQLGVGTPPRLLRLDVEAPSSGFPYRFDWSTSSDGSFFVWSGEDDEREYPAQADSLTGSSAYFLLEENGSIPVSVTVTDVYGNTVVVDSTFVVSP